MKLTNAQRLDQSLAEVGLKAILKHPKAKLYAKANHVDNFSLVMHDTAEGAVMDEVLLLFTKEDIEWLNRMCDKPYPNENKSKLYSFIKQICLTAYERLR